MDSIRFRNERNVFSIGSKKLLMYRCHLESWRQSGQSVPITLEIQPSERCNHHCPACQGQLALGISEARARARAGVNLDIRLLRSVWDAPPEGVVLSGSTGDPLVHTGIAEILAQLRERKIPVALVTNGDSLQQTLCDSILTSCRGVRFSLDADGPNLYRITHGMGVDAWNRVTDSIRMLVERRTRLRLTRQDCLIGVGFLTGRKTRESMVRATENAAKLGVDYIQFRPFHLDDSDVLNELRLCQSFDTDSFNVFGSFQKYLQVFSTERTYLRCHGAWFYTVLDPHADLYICCHHVGNPHAILGSLRDTNWPSLLRSVQRREVIEGFDVTKCLRRCRLDSHNRFLETARLVDVLPDASFEGEVSHHGPFL